MKLLLNSKEIHENLNELVKPNKIAVAYIGDGYDNLINVNLIDKIILSPTLGSNPKAIGNLVKRVKWENVFFIDNLHAKLYIGETHAIMASANLSKNGLGIDEDKTLIEMGTLVNGESTINKLNEKFEELLQLAVKMYPNEQVKKEQLEELHKLYRKAITKGIINKSNEDRVLFDHYNKEEFGKFKILWYVETGIQYNWDKVKEAFSESDEEKINENIKECLAFTEDEGITENEWILVWRKKKDGKCDRRKNPYWLYVNRLIEDGSIDESCPVLGMELKSEATPNKPFEIENDKVFKEVLYNIIDEDEDYISNINQSDQSFDEFIERLKKEYIKLSKK